MGFNWSNVCIYRNCNLSSMLHISHWLSGYLLMFYLFAWLFSKYKTTRTLLCRDENRWGTRLVLFYDLFYHLVVSNFHYSSFCIHGLISFVIWFCLLAAFNSNLKTTFNLFCGCDITVGNLIPPCFKNILTCPYIHTYISLHG